jgi:exonuclease III
MLETFIYRNNIDILMVQEVTNVNIQYLRGCTCYINIGTTQRGTAIIVKDPLTLSDVTMLTSGRGIAAKCKGLWIVNIYAPSGAAYKREREEFFNTEVAYLLRNRNAPLLLGGDFNCVLDPTDSTGETNRSRNLKELIAGYTLIDAWQAHPARQTFTHYTQHGAARLDRIYISSDLQAKKTSAVTLFAPFTDHLAMSVTITLPETMVRRGKGHWKMNITLLKERSFKEEMIACVSQWRAHIRRYKNTLDWWDSYAKKHLKGLFVRCGTEKNNDENA